MRYSSGEQKALIQKNRHTHTIPRKSFLKFSIKYFLQKCGATATKLPTKFEFQQTLTDIFLTTKRGTNQFWNSEERDVICVEFRKSIANDERKYANGGEAGARDKTQNTTRFSLVLLFLICTFFLLSFSPQNVKFFTSNQLKLEKAGGGNIYYRFSKYAALVKGMNLRAEKGLMVVRKPGKWSTTLEKVEFYKVWQIEEQTCKLQ